MLTDDEIKYSYWGDKRLKHESPRPITEVSEYKGEEVLSVSCTQLGAGAYQKRIVSEWCDALPHLDGVRTLCFESRVNQRLFDAASQMPNVGALYVKWGGIKSIASLLGNRRLQVLKLGSNPAIQDIDLLGNMTGLYVLELENVPGAYGLDFLAGLDNLEALGIDGSMDKPQLVASLEPLKHLQQLKFLSLVNTKVESGGLSPLLSIKSLVHVNTAIFYPAAEFASLRAELPLLAYGTPFNEDAIAKYAKK